MEKNVERTALPPFLPIFPCREKFGYIIYYIERKWFAGDMLVQFIYLEITSFLSLLPCPPPLKVFIFLSLKYIYIKVGYPLNLKYQLYNWCKNMTKHWITLECYIISFACNKKFNNYSNTLLLCDFPYGNACIYDFSLFIIAYLFLKPDSTITPDGRMFAYSSVFLKGSTI